MAMLACPSREMLSDYILGVLSDNASNSIDGHVRDCLDCLSKLDELNEQEDGIIRAVKRPPPDCKYERELQCTKMMATSMGFGSEIATADPDTAELGYLRDYRLVKRIGRGGMGAVYEAIHTHLNRLVALKMLPPERMQFPEAVARFQREMQAIGKLDHPNIVRAQDAGEADGKHYLVMERVDGLDLSTLTKRLGPLPVADACELIRQAAIGLQHVHEHGLIHRDIKPSNLMVTRDGDVKVLDLGLARLHADITEAEELTSTGQVMGTLDYMAPEQLGDSHTVDIRADVYGLGATLFKLLSGQAPYADEKYNTPTKKLVAIATKPARPIRDCRSDIPKGLIAVLNRMFAKNPDDRYIEPGQVAEALRPFASGCDLPRLAAGATACPEPQVDEAKASTFDHVSSALTDTSPTPSLSKSQSVVQTDHSVPRRRQPWFIAFAICFLVVAVLAIYYVKTNAGMLVVQVDDKDVEVKLKQIGVVVHDLKHNRQWTVWEPGETKMSLGNYRLTVKDDTGLEIDTEEFTLKRGGKEIVSVRRAPRSAPASQSIDDIGRDRRVHIIPEPIAVKPGSPLCKSAFVTKPASLPGVLSWTIATREAMYAAPFVRYSPDGSELALGSFDGEIRIRDADTDRLTRILIGHDGQILALEWAPIDPIIATAGSDSTVRIWDGRTGRPLRVMTAHTGEVAGVAWLSDGSTVASIGTYDKTLRLWDVATGQLLETIPTTGQPTGVDCTKDRIAVGNLDGTIAVWDAETLQIVQKFRSSEGITKLKWSPDGNLLASSLDSHNSKIFVWDTQSAKLLTELNVPGAMAWSPDGRSILAGGGIWDVHSGEMTRELPQLPKHFIHADWSTHGNNVAIETNPATVYTCNLEAPGIVRAHRSHPSVLYPGGDHTAFNLHGIITWSQNGQTILTRTIDTSGRSSPLYHWATLDGRLRRFDRDFSAPIIAPSSNGEILVQIKSNDPTRILLKNDNSGRTTKEIGGHQKNITSLAVSPDWRFVVSGSLDETARVWNIETGNEIHMLPHDGPVLRVAFSTSGAWIATATSQHVNLWDAKQLGKRHAHIEITDGGLLAFSADSSTLAIASQNGAIQLWDIATTKRFDVIESFESPPRLMQWLDRKTLITFDQDDAARYRDVSPDKLAPKRVDLPGAVFISAAFSPDGTTIALATDKVARTVDLTTGRSRTHLALRDGQYLTLSEDGHYAGSPRVERLFVYVVQTEQGQETLTPAEFAERYKWKNNPDAVRWHQ